MVYSSLAYDILCLGLLTLVIILMVLPRDCCHTKPGTPCPKLPLIVCQRGLLYNTSPGAEMGGSMQAIYLAIRDGCPSHWWSRVSSGIFPSVGQMAPRVFWYHSNGQRMKVPWGSCALATNHLQISESVPKECGKSSQLGSLELGI